jgi:hypothetical protein
MALSVVYPRLPDAVRRSMRFAVSVDGQEADVLVSAPPGPPDPRIYRGGDDGNAFNAQDDRSFSYCPFAFQGECEVTARKLGAGGTVRAIELRPSNGVGRDFDIVRSDTAARSITLRIRKPNAKISVEFIDDDWRPERELPGHALLLFADEPEESPESASAGQPGTVSVVAGTSPGKSLPIGTKALRFEPGLHRLGYYRVPPEVERIHISGGAYILGAIDGSGRDRLSVTGRGIISGEAFPWRAGKSTPDSSFASDRWLECIKLLELGKSYRVEGICMVNAPHWVLTFGTDDTEACGEIRNVKVFGNWRWNNDGIAVTKDSLVKECFVSAFDDAFKIYSSGGTVEDCVVWQMDNGAIFQLGWYPKTVRGVRARGIDVIHAEWTGRNQNWGILNMAQRNEAQSEPGVVSDLVLSDIRIEGPCAKIAGLELYGMPNQRIEDVLIERATVGSLLPRENLPFTARHGDAKSHGDPGGKPFVASGNVRGIVFKDCVVGGMRLTQAQATERCGLSLSEGADLRFE